MSRGRLDAATTVLILCLEDLDLPLRYTVVLQRLPQGRSMNTVKFFLEINKIDDKAF